MAYSKRAAFSGFTLMELLIVVAIVAILAVFAYPSYSDHVRKAARKAAAGKVLEIAGRLEQYRTQRFAYPSSAADLAGFAETEIKYEYEVTAVSTDGDVSGYTITATPVTTSDQVNDECGTLSYANDGAWTFGNSLTEQECL
ncbi:type IV pilin protein [Ketobacter alkanivorans]|nr:type IV pilin protein [Ketobacter alkanivorans]